MIEGIAILVGLVYNPRFLDLINLSAILMAWPLWLLPGTPPIYTTTDWQVTV